MKPATAAKKLGIYLPATPAEFQEGEVTRAEFLELQSNPPEWLVELRLAGPAPASGGSRRSSASRLRVSLAPVHQTF